MNRFTMAYLIAEVTEYRDSSHHSHSPRVMTWAQAIEGIAEGHELAHHQVRALEDHFLGELA